MRDELPKIFEKSLEFSQLTTPRVPQVDVINGIVRTTHRKDGAA